MNLKIDGDWRLAFSREEKKIESPLDSVYLQIYEEEVSASLSATCGLQSCESLEEGERRGPREPESGNMEGGPQQFPLEIPAIHCVYSRI